MGSGSVGHPVDRVSNEDTASANQARTFATQAGAVDGAIPLGREDDVEALHIRDEELGAVMGPQAGFNGEGAWTDEEWQDLRSLLRREKGFMATSATDLPGYTGAIGKFDIPFKDDVPEDPFHDIGQDQYMTKLDLRSGFHQIILTDDASLKTCFWWAREGAAPEQYVYKRMPFGSTNSTAMFGRVLEHESRGLSCAKVFCDDILVTSPTARQHLTDLEAVMQRLSKVGLRGHPGKLVFAAGGCEFLGFLLRPRKLSPHQAKVSLQEFEYDIEHRAGSSHTNADVLSRYPRESSLDPTRASLDPTAEEAALPTAGAFACLCARHPRTLEEGTQDVTPIATWQYETHMGSSLPGQQKGTRRCD
ncbi:hypothetical protein CYMTET_37202 [Cymbomonas tetramitiformis]|uniref:Reverse transcriptase domain-containing protein n=1 Tax=Cymbomonas tetramitiformis TaxID=36881 RepID=A0AAE0CEC5_9CHLO|nr:hypothetical protein CYMTET_37202 [Cymbomonas tetramitiformis]